MKLVSALLICLLTQQAIAQNEITPQSLTPHTKYFTILDKKIPEPVASLLSNDFSEAQFVGLAEVHQSQQLSLFTEALLPLLKKQGISNLVLENGPVSAELLQEMSKNSSETQEKLRLVNKEYGNRMFKRYPLIFASAEEDADFLIEASQQEMDFWGIDQEFIFSYQMHFDALYEASSKSETPTQQYNEIKRMIKKMYRKSILNNQFEMHKQLIEDSTIKDFFKHFDHAEKDIQYRIEALKASWDIYNAHEQRVRGSNQIRADYMKKLFDRRYNAKIALGELPRAFVKMGAVHLTKGTSIYGVDDMGKKLFEMSQENGTSFLNFKHIMRYKNGKDLIGKKGWKGMSLFMELGKKDTWTLIDLRPIREQLKKGACTTSKKNAFIIYNHDYILISPNDRKATPNF